MGLQRIFFSLTFLLGLFFSPLYLFGELLSYENQPIEDVKVEIVGITDDTALKEAILSRLKIHAGELFSQAEFDIDLKSLAAEYDRIEPRVDVEDKGLVITLKIWPKSTIRTLLWEGNKQMKTKTLREELGIKPATVFDKISFQRAINKLRTYYVKKGYYQAQIDYTLTPILVSNEIDITIIIDEGKSGVVKEILFNDFTKKEQEELRELMFTKEYCFYSSWITDEGTYREEALQQDKYGVVNYLHNQGYADAQVDFEVSQPPDTNKISIIITATRGELYTVDKITISGNSLFTEEQLRTHFCLSEGSPYSPEKIRETQQKIQDLYGKIGYIEAYVSYEPHIQLDDPCYSLDFTIDEGAQYRVGMIKVFGNCSTETKMILHETLLIPGEIFNLEKMHKTEERLENVGFFSKVNVYYVEPDSFLKECGNYRDVHIDVEETNTGRLGASLGYSTADGLFGGLNITENNFSYKGIPYLREKGYSAVRGGGEFLNLSASVGQRSRKYFLSWTKPYFLDTPWAFGFDIERSNNRYTADDYEINAWGFSLHATRTLNQFWKIVNHYRLRSSSVIITGSSSSEALKQQTHNDGIVSAFGSSLIYDATDHPRRPTKGFKSTISAELAGLWGNNRFGSVSYINTYYIKVNERDVLKFRGDVRYIFPFFGTTPHTLPLDERLFMGGDNSVRGYRPYRLGPLFKETDDPSGGVSLQLASVEYARRLGKTFGAFVFFDAGALSNKINEIGHIYTAAGLGCRWTILGDAPLTFGMGFPLNAKHRTQIKRFFINIEGTF